MVKKNRPSLNEVENENDKSGISPSSISKSKISHSSISQARILPKRESKKVMELNRRAYDEPHDQAEHLAPSSKKDSSHKDLASHLQQSMDQHSDMERIDMTSTSVKIQKCIRKLLNMKWFIICHMIVEIIYFILVMFYLFFCLEFEDDNSIVLFILMPLFLLPCLTIYIFKIIDDWKTIRAIIDSCLIVITIAFDLYEIQLRADDKGYYQGGDKTALNFARVFRGIMLQRRTRNFIIGVTNFYNTTQIKKQIKRRSSATDMLNELLNYVKDEKYLKKGINHCKDLIAKERRHQLDIKQRRDELESDRFGYNHHERMDEAEELDRCVYELHPDKDDYFKAFDYTLKKDDKVSRLLSQIETFEFDIFELRSATNGNELVTVINYLMEKHDFYSSLNIVKEKFRMYSIVIQSMYNPIAYHNKTHASDVCQTCYYFMTTCKFKERGDMNDLEQCVLLISGFVHDTDHPGYNNHYMVNTRDRIALRYNDKSVLENHHISVAFSTMLKSSETRIFENFTNEEFKIMREYMIDLVLATDNIRHYSDLNYLKTRINSMNDFDPSGKDKKAITNWMIHMADVSNPTKPWKLCYKWIDLLFVEFFHQGDKEREKGLTVSFLMDRYTTNIAGAQGGFIDNFIRPAFEVLQLILPEAIVNLRQMEENKQQWKALESDYDPKNRFTQKEIEQKSQSHDHEADEEESEEDDPEESDYDEQKGLQKTARRNEREINYTLNSSSKAKRKSTSTF